MRLNEREIRAIVSVFENLLKAIEGELYLFGSRVDDAKKGGDIDLLVVVPANQVKVISEKRLKLADQIHQHIGEQRIDITVASPNKLKEDEFLRSVFESAVRMI